MRKPILLVALALLLGCQAKETPVPAAPSTPKTLPVFVFLGDSLTAGYGVAMEEAYPALIAERWKMVEMRNAGVSGSTSAGILGNIAWNITPDVDFVFLAIGANDGLRGLDLKGTKDNIEKIITYCRERKISVALAGIKIPPNYGAEYTGAFEAMYPTIAKEAGIPLLPFLLDGVAGRPEMNIEDGIHPNADGHKVIAKSVEAFLKKEGLLK